MLTPLKAEVEAVAALLEEGAESPTVLAKAVINLVSSLREQRTTYALVFELSASGVYAGFGPYATHKGAFDSVVDNPTAYIAKRAAIVPIYGPSHTKAMSALADEPPAERGDFKLVREDALAFSRGWKGNTRDRARYLA